MTSFTNSSPELLAALSAGVVVIDKEDRVHFANECASKILGVSKERLVGRLTGALLPPIARLLAERVVGGAGEKVPLGEPWNFARPDGQIVSLDVRATHVGNRESGAAGKRYILVFLDVTTPTRVRSEQDQLLRLATMADVLSSLFHRLRNPLASIVATVEVLHEEVLDPELRRQLETVLAETTQMKLGFDGIGSVGRQLRTRRPVVVDSPLREACAVLIRQAGNRRLTIECRIADLPRLRFDPAVVRALMFQLAHNAIEASSAGGRILLAGHLIEAEAVLELLVTDWGCGMSSDVEARCTDLFFTTKEGRGGIGLAVVSQVAEEAGGNLVIHSRVGHGTTAIVRIPVESVSPKLEPRPRAIAPPG